MRARLAVVALVAALAGLAVGGGGLIVPVLALLGAATLQMLGWRRLSVILIGSTFVTAFRFNLLGANLRLEHLVLLACVAAMVAGGRGPALLSASRNRTATWFAAFVLWSALVSVVQAPSRAESLLIDGWLALDWLFLVVLLAAWDDPRRLAGVGARWAAVAAAAAVALWVSSIVAGTTFGVTTTGVEGGARAASGFAFESNLLGSTLAVWAFIALAGVANLPRRLRAAVLILALSGAALSLTRAAMLGFALGVVVWALIRGRAARRLALRMAAAVAVVTLLLLRMAPGEVRPLLQRTGAVLDFGSGTGQVRVENWTAALGDLHGLGWVTGLGSNSFGQRHIDPTQPGVPAYLGNLPLQVLYDSGFVGVFLLAGTFSTLWSRKRAQDGVGPGLVVIYLICAVATSPFWFGTTWTIVAIACLDQRRRSATPPTTSSPELPSPTAANLGSPPVDGFSSRSAADRS